MKNYRIKNSENLSEWMNNRRVMGHDIYAFKGAPPEGALYDDGDPVLREVNIAWQDITTGEMFWIEWEKI